MKLAEALLLRSEYQKKSENLQQRIYSNIKVQENDKPHEQPDQLLKELFSVHDSMCDLIQKVNKKNNECKLADGRTIAEALIERDMLIKRRNVLSGVAAKANERDFRLTHAEVKMCTTVDIAKLQKDIDDLSRDFRQLDTQIQALNWTTEL